MAKKTSKKAPSTKELLKKEVREIIVQALTDAGITFTEDSDKFGFTRGTLVVTKEDTEEKVGADLQIKFMSPKAGLDHYPMVEEEEEEE